MSIINANRYALGAIALLTVAGCGSSGSNTGSGNNGVGFGGSSFGGDQSGSGNNTGSGNSTGAGNSTGTGNTTGAGNSTGTGNTTGAGNSTGAGGESSGGGGTGNSTGGTTDTGGATDTGGTAAGGSGNTSHTPDCITNANQIAIIGDSYVTGAGSPALQPSLGADMAILTAPIPTNNYAVAGTSMVNGGIPVFGYIPDQYPKAKAAQSDIRLMIMDGGGNDILICDGTKFPNCNTDCSAAGSSTKTTCQDIVHQAIDKATALMTQMANDGIQDVVYFFYPHIPDKGAGGNGYKEILDYAEPIAKAACDGALQTSNGKLACHFVDSAVPFQNAGGDENVANFAGDGIHPSQVGQQILAKAITDRMKTDCLGQASGCCAAQ